LYEKLNPKSVTDKMRSMMQEKTIKQLKEALENELKLLKVNSFNVELAQRSSEGNVYFTIRLKGIKLPSSIDPLKILSEGEQRALAISSFLAELKAGNNPSGIIFDDPVSSLDHEWRETIAERIIEEARNRQVVVLTHNIAFLLELIELAKLRKVNVKNQSITSWQNSAGIISKDGSMPWDALEVAQQIKQLKKLLNETKIRSEEQGSSKEQYEIDIARIYSKLRSSWERAIEQVLLGGTVIRYRKSIKSQQLSSVQITLDDCILIEESTGKCSKITDAHDKSPEASVSFPRIEEVEEDINKLSNFITLVEERRKAKNNSAV